ncbi:MAG TPA: SDR family NAD(P)-dependent oxidoreductase [Pedobacter sp.]
MSKQTVLITGANKGIGLETAGQLAKAGYHILLGSRSRENGERAVEQLRSEGLEAVELIVIDVTDEQSVQQAHDVIAGRFGKLDVLINNAGIPGVFTETPSNTSDAHIKNVFETNVFGVVRTIRIFMELLKKADQPRIVNVSSDLASLTLHNDPDWEFYQFKSAVYGPSKTALNAYTVALAFELRESFKVNMVNPGYTSTEFNQHRGTKKVEDAARIIVQYAMLDENGPTGKFVSDYGETPW